MSLQQLRLCQRGFELSLEEPAAVNHWAFTIKCITMQKLFPPLSTDNRFLTIVLERLQLGTSVPVQ